MFEKIKTTIEAHPNGFRFAATMVGAAAVSAAVSVVIYQMHTVELEIPGEVLAQAVVEAAIEKK